MTLFNLLRFARRQFLQTIGGLVAGAFGATLTQAQDVPKNTNPRAIFGDSIEPDWDQHVTITVDSRQADLVGSTDRVIQAAVDYVARRSGGTVRVLPGTYRLRNSIFLQSHVRLLGSGTDSVLFKEPLRHRKAILDRADWKVLATTLVAVILAACRIVRGEETGMSLNREIVVVPAPGPVVIDGDTNDWDLSAGVWSYNTPVITDTFSVWTHLMWDAKGVYFLARFADKSPMTNATMGKDFANSWKADCYQARVILDDRTPDEHQMHINMFYSTPDQKPFMIVKHGGFGGQNDANRPGPARSAGAFRPRHGKVRRQDCHRPRPRRLHHGGVLAVELPAPERPAAGCGRIVRLRHRSYVGQRRRHARRPPPGGRHQE